MRAFLRALFGRRARLRWIHLVLGGALAMPFVLVGEVIIGPAVDDSVLGPLPLQLAGFGVGLPIAAVTSLFPLTRPLEAAAVRVLCGIDADRLAHEPARSWAARGRTAMWFTLHVGVGGIVSGMSLALPPFAVVLIVLPFYSWLTDRAPWFPEFLDHTWALALTPVAGVASLLALAGVSAGAGALLARWAPALLGPTPEDRLAAAEERAADLAVRNRLARELHDSVGHALSAVTLQASAARRVLDTDPEFVREALAAIEATTRRTVGELDAVLGVLRDGDGPGTAPAPTLGADLDDLLRRTRASGARVTAAIGTAPEDLPPVLSREAYRIVQEGLSNALRHGGENVCVALSVDVRDGRVEITVENPLGRPAAPSRPGGGHGLAGIEERARLLGGTMRAGPAGDTWRLRVRLPLRESG
ncbi:sensor histidine kinase [Streptomyces sp. NPDC052013]|uniref:sensor histidine kinase n=1 Tax=Streptomyces sp. NPDC052013 TaxID=3365679 RepID=UPI0037D8C94F